MTGDGWSSKPWNECTMSSFGNTADFEDRRILLADFYRYLYCISVTSRRHCSSAQCEIQGRNRFRVSVLLHGIHAKSSFETAFWEKKDCEIRCSRQWIGIFSDWRRLNGLWFLAVWCSTCLLSRIKNWRLRCAQIYAECHTCQQLLTFLCTSVAHSSAFKSTDRKGEILKLHNWDHFVWATKTAKGSSLDKSNKNFIMSSNKNFILFFSFS